MFLREAKEGLPRGRRQRGLGHLHRYLSAGSTVASELGRPSLSFVCFMSLVQSLEKLIADA